ncbi:hypothetical protein [Thermospira aquatica]|uniref:DUF2993 domain-containing protein n=1 Tax=Thermospira aquatica TaxID=2828656 RepID=A0AAX3BA37_9SPIR|nr:hypothetical protein [Thermospira aquatica]URA09110.1 hypothetical protein KDW03_06270 [Thermospira aquatica]
MKKLLVILCGLWLGGIVWAEADASIILHQSTLNKFLQAVGPVQKTESFSIGSIRGQYRWLVQNPRLILVPGRARFEADVTVSLVSPSLRYSTPAYGEVSVVYDSVSNRINIKVEKVAFEVAFTLMGKRIRIAEIDISRFYQIAFGFPGPKPFEAVVDVAMPDGSKRPIKIETKPVLAIENERIVVGSELVYTPMR